MSDLRRYLDDEHAEDIARRLVTSARQDDVDDARADDLMRAIAARSGLSPVSRDQGPAMDTPPAPPSGSRLLVLTTVALVAVSAALVTTSIERRPATAPAVPTAAAPAITASASPSSTPPADVATGSFETVSVDRLPDAAPSPVSARPAPSTAPRATKVSTPSEPTDLAGEVRALERVRAALANHDVGAARDGLRYYERSFPNKLLGEEARALEIERLLAEGRRDEAEALARAFLASSGDTPYATRVRTLIGPSRLP